MTFEDRREAGRYLADRLRDYAGRGDVVVLALPRGGVPVAYEVARALDAPLDVFVVRKLGAPGHEEYAVGAVAHGGARVVNYEALDLLGISDEILDAIATRERRELERREALYRGDRPFPDLAGRTVILVDDGLATGSSMRAAVKAVRALRPRKVVVAVPVGSGTTCAELAADVDEVVCAVTPARFFAVGMWYRDFSQTTDEEVRALLEEAAADQRPGVTDSP